MSSIDIYILSISFQVAGGLILLLWSFGRTKEKVIQLYFPGSNIVERDEHNKVCLDKKKLRKKAVDIYMNRFAFICLIIGYGLSLFGDISDYNRWKALCIIEIESIVIILISIIISNVLSIIYFRKDEYIDFDELEGVDTFMTEAEGDSILDSLDLYNNTSS